jgi:SAM-dependent methyltransferase
VHELICERPFMKVRESGMPDQETWESFFDADFILTGLGLNSGCGDVVEFGCGYGTFTIPAARRISGTVYALDIDGSMTETARSRAEAAEIANVEFVTRDFVADGTGLATGSMGFAFLFNILHHEDSTGILREAHRNLRDGGSAGVLHWSYDPDTPRGPPMSMRPRPEQCAEWAEEAGFAVADGIILFPPYHYGLLLRRSDNKTPEL